MKLKVLQWLTGKFGPLVTPVIASLIGTLIGYLYTWIGKMLHKVPALERYFHDVWIGLPVAVQESLHPMAIGAVFGLIAYGFIQEALNKFFIKDVKQQQRSLNTVLPATHKLKVDGIPLEKTQNARDAVHDVVQEAIQVRKAIPAFMTAHDLQHPPKE